DVEQPQDAALLVAEQLFQHGRIDPRHGDVRTDAIDDQRPQQKPEPPFQVRVLAACLECGVLCQPYASMPPTRPPLRSRRARPWLRAGPTASPPCRACRS